MLTSRPGMTLVIGMKEIQRVYGVYGGVMQATREFPTHYLAHFVYGFLKGQILLLFTLTCDLSLTTVYSDSAAANRFGIMCLVGSEVAHTVRTFLSCIYLQAGWNLVATCITASRLILLVSSLYQIRLSHATERHYNVNNMVEYCPTMR